MARQLPDSVKGVVVAAHMHPVARQTGWHLDNLTGRLVELPGHADTAALTLVTGMVLETQRRGESVAWISAVDSLFYPPDFARAGIDLAALPIVRVQKGLQAARAADALIRSGGFGAIVIDLGNQTSMTLSVQTRLAGLARRHDVAVLALTRRVSGATRAERRRARREQPKASLGALVSLWAESHRERTSRDRFACEVRVRKDKRSGSPADRDRTDSADVVWRHLEFCRGPEGLC